MPDNEYKFTTNNYVKNTPWRTGKLFRTNLI